VSEETGEIIAYLGLTRKRPAVTEEEVKKSAGNLTSNVPNGIVPDVLKEVVRAVGEVEEGNLWKGKDYYGSFRSLPPLF